MLSQASPEIKKSTSILEVMSKDKDTRMKYEAREAKLHDIATGLEEAEERGMEKGMEKGRQEAKIEMVKDLIASGAEIELIIKISKLSREEIEEIKRSLV